ncbi:MAG: hypothetical protein HQK54_03000 [Oligoflexales bacterium]|nr:hypothetical protein [Oligoflexales bacterium]
MTKAGHTSNKLTITVLMIWATLYGCVPSDKKDSAWPPVSALKASNAVYGGAEEVSYKGPLEFTIYHGDIISDLKKKYGGSSGGLSLVNGGQDSVGDVNMVEPAPMNEDVKWPKAPRVIFNSDVGAEFAFSVHLGYEGNLLDIVKVAGVDTLTLTQRVIKQLFLIKHIEDGKGRMFVKTIEKDEDGKEREVVKPDISDKEAYVGICVHTLNFETSNKFLSSLKIAGNGFTSTSLSSDRISMSAWSGYFNIDSKDSLVSLENLCKGSFSQKVKDNLADDLKRAIIAQYGISFDVNGSLTETTAVNSTLYGPGIDRLKLRGHHWNFRKGKIRKSGNSVSLEGSFIRSIKGLRDDEVKYSCSVNDTLNFEPEVSFVDRSFQYDYKNAAKEVVRMFCHDAYVEFIDLADGEY